MDRGILAIWYDLPDDGRDEHLAWLHEVHLPGLLSQRQDILWAAHFQNAGHSEKFHQVISRMRRAEPAEVPSGSNYLLLLGAESSYTFFNPNVDQIAERRNAADAEMVARRIDAHTCVFSEEARVDGPDIDARAPGAALGPYIQMGHYRVDTAEHEHDLGAWYAQLRLPFAARMPGSIAARKLVVSAGWGKHSVLYEFVSSAAREQGFVPHEADGLDESSWTYRVHQHLIHAPVSPFVGPRIWPPIEERVDA